MNRDIEAILLVVASLACGVCFGLLLAWRG